MTGEFFCDIFFGLVMWHQLFENSHRGGSYDHSLRYPGDLQEPQCPGRDQRVHSGFRRHGAALAAHVPRHTNGVRSQRAGAAGEGYRTRVRVGLAGHVLYQGLPAGGPERDVDAVLLQRQHSCRPPRDRG